MIQTMKFPARCSATLATLAMVSIGSAAFAQSLVVSRVGDNSATLTSAATAEFLDQYSLSGTLLGTVALPTVASGSNFASTDSGSATSDDMLSLSTDGHYLLSTGYNDPLGTTGVTGSTAAAVNRVVDVTNISGATTTAANIDSSTALNNTYSANNIRGAASTTGGAGATIFTAGAGTTTDGGVRITTQGATTAAQVESSSVNTRVAGIFNNTLYFTSGSTGFKGVNSVGAAGTLPTTNGTSSVIVTDPGGSPYGFYFADPNTLYVADSSVGLLKFVGTGGSATTFATFGSTPAFQIAPAAVGAAAQGLFGLTGVTAGGVTTLYGVSGAASGSAGSNSLVSFIDNGSLSGTQAAGTGFTLLATGPANEEFHGVAYLSNNTIFPTPSATPEPSGVVAMLLGVGVLGLIAARRRVTA